MKPWHISLGAFVGFMTAAICALHILLRMVRKNAEVDEKQKSVDVHRECNTGRIPRPSGIFMQRSVRSDDSSRSSNTGRPSDKE
jgi:hypothetical protein